MYFDGLPQLLAMDGHGVYVWSVYSVATLIIATLAMSPLVKRRRFVREEIQRQRREGKA